MSNFEWLIFGLKKKKNKKQNAQKPKQNTQSYEHLNLILTGGEGRRNLLI